MRNTEIMIATIVVPECPEPPGGVLVVGSVEVT